MTARQFYITLFLLVVSLKVQKLPSLIASDLGKDTYLLVLLYLVVNLILIAFAFFILKKTDGEPFFQNSKSKALNVFSKVLSLAIMLYFLSQGLLLFESIQNLFSHVLFYELPWTLFSLMLIFAVFFLAYTGIKNISLNFELYAAIIIISYIVLAIFGGTKADFEAILPFQTINFKTVASGLLDFNLWFGDFFLVLVMGKHAKHIKLKWTSLVYAVSMLFVCLLYIEFFGIYKDYTPMKPSLISVLSEQSMLGVNIGRVDWFFILFTEIGTILSSGACIYFAKKCLENVFPKAKSTWLLLGLMLLIYLVDIFYLVDINKQKELFVDYAKYFALAVKFLTLLILFFFAVGRKRKSDEKTDDFKLEKAGDER